MRAASALARCRAPARSAPSLQSWSRRSRLRSPDPVSILPARRPALVRPRPDSLPMNPRPSPDEGKARCRAPARSAPSLQSWSRRFRLRSPDPVSILPARRPALVRPRPDSLPMNPRPSPDEGKARCRAPARSAPSLQSWSRRSRLRSPDPVSILPARRPALVRPRPDSLPMNPRPSPDEGKERLRIKMNLMLNGTGWHGPVRPNAPLIVPRIPGIPRIANPAHGEWPHDAPEGH